MPRPRTTSSKRDREFKKRERDRIKREKAALKRERREAKTAVQKPVDPGAAGGTEAGGQPSDDEDASVSLSEEGEVDGSESRAV